ncbi:ABC-2 type transporter [Isosphaera pallida ATCC 43644]|uniref:ABC-2 type transporter n=2 Tax=Isosphaera pallida TaxID=128 RepID=E8R220_ISOPI|nr:ABC-2 type transporter [Isosphaera pallida ATCC 43644]
MGTNSVPYHRMLKPDTPPLGDGSMMSPGPVFFFECLRVSRKKRLFLSRFALGMIVLVVLGLVGYNTVDGTFDGEDQISHTQASQLALGFFSAIFFPLSISILAMTPGTFASLIPEDRQRKILFAMLTTPLSGIEIILGKFLIRYLVLVSYLAISLPIVAILNLYGGVPPTILAAAYGSTIAAIWLYGALAMWVSARSRNPRSANSTAFILIGSLLFFPFLIRNSPPNGTFLEPWLTIYSGLFWINSFLEPFSLLCLAFDVSVNLGSNVFDATGFATTLGLQFAAGAVALGWAGLTLRRSNRRLEDTASKWLWFKGGSDRRIAPVPPVGDDPLFWKEGQLQPRCSVGAVVKMVVLALVLLSWLFANGYFAFWRIGEILGWSPMAGWFMDFHTFSGDSERDAFNEFTRFVTAIAMFFWLLGVSSLTAATLTLEREKDTWISLIATPLSAHEILRGKVLGILWKTRLFPIVIVTQLTLAVLLGAVHPLGAVLTAIPTMTMLTFACCLGIYFSAGYEKTSSAQSATIASQFFMYFGLFCFLASIFPLGRSDFLRELLLGVTSQPLIFIFAQFVEVNEIEIWSSYLISDQIILIYLAYLAIGSSLYGFFSFVLWKQALARFLKRADRPRRFGVGLHSVEG